MKLQVLGWYQIVGGIAGILLTFWLLLRTSQLNGLVVSIILFAFILYAFSAYCGILLLRNKYALGFNLSVINQVLQIVSFTIAGYGFMYISGAMLLGKIGWDSGLALGFNFSLTSTWQINIQSDDQSFSLGFNFVAIYAVYFIDKLRTTIKQEKLAYENGLQNPTPIVTEEPLS